MRIAAMTLRRFRCRLLTKPVIKRDRHVLDSRTVLLITAIAR